MSGRSVAESLKAEYRRIRNVQVRNIQTLRRRPLQEISGSFGDLGTFLPILVALGGPLGPSRAHSTSVPSSLIFSGLANIVTGIIFGIPLPVQPMKAIAAVAITEEFTMAQIASAGLFVAGVVGFLSITGLLNWFNRTIPIPIIKGIQIGTGLSLMISAGTFLKAEGDFTTIRSFAITSVVMLILLIGASYARVPLVLIVVLLAIPLIFIQTTDQLSLPHLSVWKPQFLLPSLSEFRIGAVNAGLGQIPLTTLNSVIAVAYLAADLLPDIETPSVTAFGLSVAAMNLVGCWFGAMPVCHGSGGLAAQYRFGARSGASVVFLGFLKLVLGLFASDYVLAFCKVISGVPLAVLLFLAGFELAKVGESLNTEGARDLWEYDLLDEDMNIYKKSKDITPEERMRRWSMMTATTGVLLAMKNDGAGFLAGMTLYGAFQLEEWRKSRREGQIALTNEESNEESNEGSARLL